MKYLLIFNLLLYAVYSYTLNQWSSIRKILSNENTDNDTKNKIRTKIYIGHVEKWTYYNSWEFKRKFKKKKFIRDVDIDELNYYAIKGLYHSCKNYKGYQPFYMYAKPIVYYSLLKGMTELNHINRLPHYYITNRKWKNKNKVLYNRLMEPPIYTSENDFEPYKKIVNDKYSIKEIQEAILNLNNYDRKLFCYVYDINTLKKKRTMKQAGELMCFSTEKIRQDFIRIKANISSQL